MPGFFYENARYSLEVRRQRLATELNEDYPDIDHEAVIPVPAAAESALAKPAWQSV
jgi:hypothetical protein